jgi:hypothetical protein
VVGLHKISGKKQPDKKFGQVPDEIDDPEHFDLLFEVYFFVIDDYLIVFQFFML